VALSLFTDFEHFSILRPTAHQEEALTGMLDQLIAWGSALNTVRSG
jgi:hypothetical protein